MRTSVLQLKAQLLEQQIELEESNYKYAIQIGKDYATLRKIREIIRELKETLLMIRRKVKKE